MFSRKLLKLYFFVLTLTLPTHNQSVVASLNSYHTDYREDELPTNREQQDKKTKIDNEVTLASNVRRRTSVKGIDKKIGVDIQADSLRHMPKRARPNNRKRRNDKSDKKRRGEGEDIASHQRSNEIKATANARGRKRQKSKIQKEPKKEVVANDRVFGPLEKILLIKALRDKRNTGAGDESTSPMPSAAPSYAEPVDGSAPPSDAPSLIPSAAPSTLAAGRF